MLPISVAVVDDHPFLRLAVKNVLEQHNFKVVVEADNGLDAVALPRKEEFKLMILDLGIPQLDGLEVIHRLAQRHPDVFIIVLTAQEPSIYAVRCAEAGAHGILSKSQELNKLVDMAHKVLRGQKVFPQPEYYGERLAESESELLASLSNRELQILNLLCKGKANKDIADEISISFKTVSTHKTNLLVKLGLSSMIELVDFARRNGLNG
ncbi:DNA-binding response regulator [Rheinheimera mesophila]|uniref:DNA-binding response regulator n=1 Tax=Rheinheimera mesophila TaxID=1547515 RepID=A0A3P3QBR8_9GAMM|nr:response regulator transcription factor [Rheinheimera mesophila]KKL00503.1 hypothetical protein SD53_14495 [Rheinheimera mesophila]RRJ18495.1 DNA-binding response regulator [Rheinheimera mesophila]